MQWVLLLKGILSSLLPALLFYVTGAELMFMLLVKRSCSLPMKTAVIGRLLFGKVIKIFKRHRWSLVVDHEEGNIRLSAEDLAGGYFDRNGKPLKTIGKRLMDLSITTIKTCCYHWC